MPITVERLREELASRYAIERELGSGGSATVYLARDLKHGRRVALKILRPELAEEIGTSRFLKEIAVTARLQHPNILQLYDSGEVDGLPFYVTPYVEGESLRARLDREGPLPLDEALRIARSVGSALAYAHERDVLHRDVKPENVLLQADQPLVADFGIALALSEASTERMTGTGVSIGTPGYMSPEQVAGERAIDARTDVYALGGLLYELLAGAPPFRATDATALAARVLSEPPDPLRSHRPDVPAEIEAAVHRALRKSPDERFSSVAELTEALHVPGAAHAGATPAARGLRVAAPAALIVVVAVGGWWWAQERAEGERQRWARTEAIPEIERRIGEWDNVGALQLASRAIEYLPDDPTLTALMNQASSVTPLTSDPSGALVHYRGYGEDAVWTEVGTTPDSARLPSQQIMVRFERDGYRPIVVAGFPTLEVFHVRLVPDSAADMVWIPAGTYAFGEEPVAVDSFWLDRLEVSNRAYQAFVEAGGYSDPQWWPPFEDDGVPLDFEEAVARFEDATGRPGPLGWELSRAPEGRALHPVGGLSWYEAVAYCRWAGKELPTFYHWKHAAGVDPFDNILKASVLATEDPAPVGESGAVGFHGTLDLAGNAREWVWNETRGLRFILGGAWDSPAYMFQDRDAVSAWDRDIRNGVRCARYHDPPPPDLLREIEEPLYDFRGHEPVDDETYAFWTTLFEYDRRPLEPRVLSTDTAADWIHQRVEFTAAYEGERLPAHLFLPRNVPAPYQTVVYFPGSSAFLTSTSENDPEIARLMFLPRSGRALIVPVFRGTWERRYDAPSVGPAEQRERYIRLTQDVMRTVDYVHTREDLDQERLAYMGLSFGAEVASPVAVERRFDALVLIGAGLDPAWRGLVPEEVAPWNHVTRITTPTLLLNGRLDYMHPYEESQIPFFEGLDVPAEDKRFVLLEGTGHVPEWNVVIRHTLGWLDERLGEVSQPR